MELEERFKEAAAQMETLVPELSSDDLLEFYALYKQATVGPCNIPRPAWHQMQAKHKWDAWKKLGEMSHEDAMHDYIRKLCTINPTWEESSGSRSENQGWVAVSRLQAEDEIPDEEKTFFDWIKDGNDKMVEEIIREDPSLVNTPDETGLLPIHWATDRGYLSIVRLLVENGADVNARDDEGRTPLHYATDCEHEEVVQYLLSVGGVPMEDYEGLKPSGLAD